MADKELSRKVISRLLIKDGRQLTQIAEDLGVSRQRLGQYRSGSRFPDADFIQKWQKTFGQNLMEMMEDETGGETNVSRETKNGTSVHKTSDNKENPLRVFEEMYEKFLGANSDYLVIHKEVLREHRLVALEQFEKDKQQLEQTQKELDAQLKHIEKLTDMIGAITTRPINIQLTNPERA